MVPKIPVSFLSADNVKEAKEKVLTLTSQYGEITKDGLSEFMLGAEIDLWFLDDVRFPEIPSFNFDVDPNALPKGDMSAKFGVPPFSVLNAREGAWQDRKRAWISLGIKSELGRGGTNGGGAHGPDFNATDIEMANSGQRSAVSGQR